MMNNNNKEKKFTFNILGKKIKACCPECAIRKGLKMKCPPKKR